MARPKGSKNKKTIRAAAATAAVLSPEAIQVQIKAVSDEIASLNAALKEKKAQMKKLQKEKVAAEKAAEKMKAEKDKEAILAAIEASSKSYDEILEMLL